MLLVEEDIGKLHFYRGVLRELGYDVHSCGSFQAGAKLLEPDAFDLVIVSQGRGSFEGRCVVEHAHQIDPHLPILVVASCPGTSCCEEAMQLGAVECLAAPVTMRELGRAVKAHLRMRPNLQALSSAEQVRAGVSFESWEERSMPRDVVAEEFGAPGPTDDGGALEAIVGEGMRRTCPFLAPMAIRNSYAPAQRRLPANRPHLTLIRHDQDSAVLEERKRIAGEIHDTLSQTITGIMLHMEVARRLMPTSARKATLQIRHAQELARESLGQVSRSVWALRPRELDGKGLRRAVHRFVQRMAASTDTVVQYCVSGNPYPLPRGVPLPLLRICQEAVVNALRHAKASTIRIRISYEPSAVELSVRDDGNGFDPQRLDTSHGLGLIGMQERAEHIDAKFEVHSEPGMGTRVVARVPVQNRRAVCRN